MTLEVRKVRYKPSPVVDAVEATRENLQELVAKVSGSSMPFYVKDGKVYRNQDNSLSFEVGDFLIFDEDSVWLDVLKAHEINTYFDFVDPS